MATSYRPAVPGTLAECIISPTIACWGGNQQLVCTLAYVDSLISDTFHHTDPALFHFISPVLLGLLPHGALPSNYVSGYVSTMCLMISIVQRRIDRQLTWQGAICVGADELRRNLATWSVSVAIRSRVDKQFCLSNSQQRWQVARWGCFGWSAQQHGMSSVTYNDSWGVNGPVWHQDWLRVNCPSWPFSWRFPLSS